MAKRYNKFTMKRPEGYSIDFDDCAEMLQEGYSDTEISNELGVDESYIRRLREEYERDY